MRKLQWLGAVVGCGVLASACADEKGVFGDDPTLMFPGSPTKGDNSANPAGDSGLVDDDAAVTSTTTSAGTTTASPGSGSAVSSAGAIATSPATSSVPSINLPPADGVTLGGPCTQDDDCGAGQFCLQEESEIFFGTIAGGVCTADCSDDPRVCQAFGVPAGCLAGETRAYCITRCTTGSLAVQCHGRPDTVCLPLNVYYTDGACLPMCQSDADCPGQVCQPSVLLVSNVGELWKEGGVCVNPDPTAPELKQDGESCTLDTDCKGQWCMPVSAEATEGVCSTLCNFATEGLACHPEADEPVLSACLESVFSSIARVGELGLCYPACDTDTDCHSGLVCTKDQSVVDAIGRAGLCTLPGAVEPTPPVESDAG